MANLLINKPATASTYVLPYSPARAVDGTITPTNRWLCNQLPGYMSVNMGGSFWINRWVVRHMGITGWASPDYNMMDFKLQGSSDNTNWIDIDSVTGNTAAVTDRTFSVVKYQYVRLVVTKGIRNNQQLASCMELEVYESPVTSSYLSALTISTGTLTPVFAQTTFAYTTSVDNSVSSITVTPTSIDGGTIQVSGVAVTSGQPSQAINLNVGTNVVPIAVSSRIGGVTTTYNITITRQANPWLTGLVVKNSEGTVLSSIPSFSSTTMEYVVNTEYDLASTPGAYSVTLTPSVDTGATITVNNVAVVSGQASVPINLLVGNNTVSVNSTNGVLKKNYTITINRTTSSNLTNLTVKNGKATYAITPSFNRYVITYDVNSLPSSVSAVGILASLEDASAVIRVNGTVVANNVVSPFVTLNPGLNTILVTVTPTTGTQVKTYTIRIQK